MRTLLLALLSALLLFAACSSPQNRGTASPHPIEYQRKTPPKDHTPPPDDSPLSEQRDWR